MQKMVSALEGLLIASKFSLSIWWGKGKLYLGGYQWDAQVSANVTRMSVALGSLFYYPPEVFGVVISVLLETRWGTSVGCVWVWFFFWCVFLLLLLFVGSYFGFGSSHWKSWAWFLLAAMLLWVDPVHLVTIVKNMCLPGLQSAWAVKSLQ